MRWTALIAVALMATTSQAETFKDLVGDVTVKDVQASATTEVRTLTWGGDIATLWANGGETTTPNSIYGKAGLKLKLSSGDDFIGSTKAYVEGKTPLLRGTFRMLGLASQVLNESPKTKPVMILQMTFSQGDHLVSREEVKSMADLKGKTVVLQRGGPHVGLLDDALRAANMKWSDIKVRWAKDLTASDDSPAEIFRKNKDVGACCVITPDMIGLCSGLDQKGSGAEGTVKNSHVLVSTATMNRSIADVYVARSDFYESAKGREWCEKFVTGYLKATEELLTEQKKYADGTGSSPKYVAVLKQAQKYFGEDVLPTIEEDAHGLALDAKFVRIPGNEAFFNNTNNPVGFEAKQKASLDVAATLGYTTARTGFEKADFDYKKISAAVGVKYVEPTFATGRIRAEKINFEELDDKVILSFQINFEAGQTTFNADSYGAEFKRVIDNAALFGNGAVVIRGHSDTFFVLQNFFRAARAKGLITGSPGSYMFKGKRLDLTDTAAILAAVQSENLAGQVYTKADGTKIAVDDPRQTAQAARSLSYQRASSVKKAIEAYAKANGESIDISQVQPVGAGITRPVVPRPRSTADMTKNRRVEFLVIKVQAEAVKVDDFNFDE